ncbi:glycerol-3-phosphate dehydrogenase/oxidase [Alicyclobacillus sp.]|uniref:glycerol-3-phosphate dehydrogenase/oxidase n=1 Tax=Alicyclobacillus sp. TaxID=61169 RepID=UPI0025BBA1B1|nr:glycerol-3-phosphate dehydrogenase/oxidase [Alicyclobacillus sp.]
MAKERLDLLVIGGGITGAGIALDAAARGLRVGLVEKWDFAAGTSGRSTKLIHGGLRYLKQGEIHLVREVGRERAILYRNAPHVVVPERMLLPILRGGSLGRGMTAFGLWLYDRLADVQPAERRVMLSRAETLTAEPLLSPERLIGGGLYYEYRTDDARLTIEVVKTAAALGALCVNRAEAVALLYDAGRIRGAVVLDRESGEEHTVTARQVVNAAGPWVDELRRMDRSLDDRRLHLTKGVHVVVPRSRLPLRQSVYFDVEDGRMVFAIPRDAVTYIGTTDTDYDGPLDQPPVLLEDVRYLLRAANHMFSGVHLTPGDVCSGWAGLRPLIHEEGRSPSELSRKDEIFLSPTGLISIAGGKLTAYRKMAERAVDVVMRRLAETEGRPWRPSRTADIPLSGGERGKAETLAEMRALRVPAPADAGDARVMEDRIRRLYRRYGCNAPAIWADAMRQAERTEEVDEKLLEAEFRYGVEEEMVCNPCDFLVRRTGALHFEPDQAHERFRRVLSRATAWFGWDEARVAREVEAWEAQRQAAAGFTTLPSQGRGRP